MLNRAEQEGFPRAPWPHNKEALPVISRWRDCLSYGVVASVLISAEAECCSIRNSRDSHSVQLIQLARHHIPYVDRCCFAYPLYHSQILLAKSQIASVGCFLLSL